MARQGNAETAIAVALAPRRRPTVAARLLRFILRKPLGAVGAVLAMSLVVMGVFAPTIAPYDPYKIDANATFISPSFPHLLGTDDFGRDVFSRILFGARISLLVSLMAVVWGSTAGALIGWISGFWLGKVDITVQRVMDIMMSFPLLVLALAIVAALGPSLWNVIIAISIVIIPRSARVNRSAALAVREMQYVDAAKAIGCSQWRSLFVHVIPNCMAPFIIIATAELGEAILVEASLSFLGVGVPPPEPSWGSMLTMASRDYLQKAPWMAIFPGLAITIVVFGFNLLGDALRDVLDPRLRRG